MSEADIQHNLLILDQAANDLDRFGLAEHAGLLRELVRYANLHEDGFFRETATLTAIETLQCFIAYFNQPRRESFLCEPA